MRVFPPCRLRVRVRVLSDPRFVGGRRRGTRFYSRAATARSLARTLLITGFSPATSGHILECVLNQYAPTPETPVVLVIDEFDIAVNNALEKLASPSKHYFFVHCVDKIGLTAFLDMLNNYPNLICIATSNRPLEWWRAPYATASNAADADAPARVCDPRGPLCERRDHGAAHAGGRARRV